MNNEQLRTMRTALERALRECRLAYRFNPSSYTFEALNACEAAAAHLEKVRGGEQ
jgi:hypothetical protein